MILEQLDDGTWYASDEKFSGCWGTGETKSAAIRDLSSVVAALSNLNRWPLLARNVPEALDELEAHWRHALESGAHVEGDWRDLGLVGNERHRFDHARAWAEGGRKEDLLGQTGRGLMVRQLMIEAKSAID